MRNHGGSDPTLSRRSAFALELARTCFGSGSGPVVIRVRRRETNARRTEAREVLPGCLRADKVAPQSVSGFAHLRGKGNMFEPRIVSRCDFVDRGEYAIANLRRNAPFF